MSLIQKAFETFQISSSGFSINLSYLDMTNIVTTTFIIEKLEEFNVGPWVIFEILESDGIENYEAIAKFIDQVKSYGAKIAIDSLRSACMPPIACRRSGLPAGSSLAKAFEPSELARLTCRCMPEPAISL